jgi:hypothetical protein
VEFTEDDYIRIGTLLEDNLITLILCQKCAGGIRPNHEDETGVAVGTLVSS